jgi:hypothetical protein
MEILCTLFRCDRFLRIQLRKNIIMNKQCRYAVPQNRDSFNIATNGIGSLNLYRFNVIFFISIRQGTAYRFRL